MANAVESSAPSVADRPLPPYPEGIPGHPRMHFLALALDPLKYGRKLEEEEPDLVRYWLPGAGDVYNPGHPDHLRQILVTDRDAFGKSDDFRVAFGEGLLTVEGEEWRQQRDVLQPLFEREAVTGYADGMLEQITRRVDRWSPGEELELQRCFTNMTLDVLFATVLGRELAIDGDEELRTAAESLNDWFAPSSYVLPSWIPTPARRRFRRAKTTLQRECERLLEDAGSEPPTDPAAASDLLSLLVGLREAGMADEAGMLTDERLRDQMVTMIFAGHDTTTTALTFSCWCLANNPEVAERFYEEVDGIDGEVTIDDVDDLEVTDRVVTEALRLFPPVHNLPRRTTRDVEVGGYRIPADSQVHIPIIGIQRDERWFDDPDTFRPSRWDGSLRQEIPPFAYAPFGGGPRICIGRTFALLEAKLALAAIGRRFELEWLGENSEDGDPPVVPQMTLRMEEGQHFRLRERHDGR